MDWSAGGRGTASLKVWPIAVRILERAFQCFRSTGVLNLATHVDGLGHRSSRVAELVGDLPRTLTVLAMDKHRVDATQPGAPIIPSSTGLA